MATIPVIGKVTIFPAGSKFPVSLRNAYLGTNFVMATQGLYPQRNWYRHGTLQRASHSGIAAGLRPFYIDWSPAHVRSVNN